MEHERMDAKDKEKQPKIVTDPFGSYTGRSVDGKPVQDADDL